jgi:hypothetical protein
LTKRSTRRRDHVLMQGLALVLALLALAPFLWLP